MKYLIILALLEACNPSPRVIFYYNPDIVSDTLIVQGDTMVNLNNKWWDDSFLSSNIGDYDTTAIAQAEEDANDTIPDGERICYDSLVLEICTYPPSWQWYYFKGKCNVADTMGEITFTFTPDRPTVAPKPKPKGNLDTYLHWKWDYQRRWDSLRVNRVKDRL